MLDEINPFGVTVEFENLEAEALRSTASLVPGSYQTRRVQYVLVVGGSPGSAANGIRMIGASVVNCW